MTKKAETTIQVEGFADTDDPIVWERSSIVAGDGRFRIKSLTRSARDGLLKAFGQEWLDKYLADAEREIEAFGKH